MYNKPLGSQLPLGQEEVGGRHVVVLVPEEDDHDDVGEDDHDD